MIEIYQTFKRMEARPAMWTGELSLKSIKTFSDGYLFALSENNLIEPNPNEVLNFHDWVANKLGFSHSTAGWHNMILADTIGLDPKNVNWDNYSSEVTKGQHGKSIRTFYKLLGEFVDAQSSRQRLIQR